MFHDLLQRMYEAVDQEQLMTLAREIHKTDSHFTFPKFRETANKMARTLKEWGCEAVVLNGPADGKTVIGDWRMPIAWDCKSARLEIVSPKDMKGQVLADRKDANTAVVQYSGGTPPEGIEADVVEGHTYKEINDLIAAGKLKHRILFTSLSPREVRLKLNGSGCVGIVSSYTKYPELNPDATFWMNSWSERPGAWAPGADEKPFPGMMITPATGQRLSIWLKGGSVRVKMTIDARTYEGQLPIASGGIAPQAGRKDEVLVFGHAYEQGPDDNASGVAVSFHTIQTLKKLIDQGVLAAPKRGVRSITVSECYGTLAFMQRNRNLLKKTVAALNWDCVATHHEKMHMPFPVHHNPYSSWSFTDTLITRLFEQGYKRYNHYFNWYETGYGMGDTFLMDPEFGVPLVYGGGATDHWHTTNDSFDDFHWPNYHLVAAISATFCYFLANAGVKEARWLAEETAADWAKRLQEAVSLAVSALTNPQQTPVPFGPYARKSFADMPREEALGQVLDYLDFLRDVGIKAVQSVNRLLDQNERTELRDELKGVARSLERIAREEGKRIRHLAQGVEPKLPSSPELAEAAALEAPHKLFFGPPAYDTIAAEDIAAAGLSSPRWDGVLQLALFWTDGKTKLDTIIRRVEYETHKGPAAPHILTNYKFMERHGRVSFGPPEKKAALAAEVANLGATAVIPPSPESKATAPTVADAIADDDLASDTTGTTESADALPDEVAVAPTPTPSTAPDAEPPSA
ncbi:MAG: M28 family peptidase [Planctomycetota bacterium]